ncbi:MAG TPA: alanine racemase, partial [Actinomycetota bacterium]|nr:alanine racemase [Actinomycetota bacterium]
PAMPPSSTGSSRRSSALREVGVAIALALAVASGCGGRDGRSPHPPAAHRLVILGFDGVDPRFLSGWMEEGKLPRLRALAERARVRTTTDSVEVAAGLGRVGRDLGRAVEVLVEVDTGLHRMGQPPGEPTVALVTELVRVEGIEVVGLLTHAGHAYRTRTPEELRANAEREGLDLVATAERCATEGVELREISVGSTPTARLVAGVAGITEIRPGTYVFNDVQQMRLGVATEATCAARVVTTVVAHPSEERFVLDAGTKAFTADGGDGPPFPGRGVVAGRPDLVLDFMNEEHTVGHRTGADDVRIGDRLEVIPLHVCSTVNMFDEAVGVRDGDVERMFAIAGRGRMR